MNAEEFYENNKYKITVKTDDNWFKNSIISMMEAYHKSKVEAISDEMEERLNEMVNNDETDLSWICGYQEALELLKQ